jgi:hypothetical protein
MTYWLIFMVINCSSANCDDIFFVWLRIQDYLKNRTGVVFQEEDSEYG